MAKQDFYETLGLKKGASVDEIKRAYREMAKKHHPDLSGGDAEKFKAVNEAYEVLKDDQKRAAYDRMGHQAFEGGGAGGGGGFGGFNFHASQFDMGGLEDIISDLFGMGRGQRPGGAEYTRGGGQRGSDLQYRVSITLEDAFKGVTKEVRYKTSVKCDKCNGTGSQSGKTATCKTCGGTGAVRSGVGFFTMESTCPACRGSGRQITDPCPKCKSSGAILQEKVLNVHIPKGSDTGTRLRLKNEGQAGVNGGEPGDLYVVIEVARHKQFQRRVQDLELDITIGMVDAALGAQIQVPTIEGMQHTVAIPDGTQNGSILKVKGKGMPVFNHPTATGDMYVHVQVRTPTKLSRKQKELLKEFNAVA